MLFEILKQCFKNVEMALHCSFIYFGGGVRVKNTKYKYARKLS